MSPNKPQQIYSNQRLFIWSLIKICCFPEKNVGGINGLNTVSPPLRLQNISVEVLPYGKLASLTINNTLGKYYKTKLRKTARVYFYQNQENDEELFWQNNMYLFLNFKVIHRISVCDPTKSDNFTLLLNLKP